MPESIPLHATARGALALAFANLLPIPALAAQTWTHRSFASRYSSAAAYDSLRERVVVFGGLTVIDALADTFEWDGAVWQRRRPPHQPPVRFDHAMAFDAARGEVVLFGGNSDILTNNRLDDTWVFDGVDWRQVASPTRPSARSQHAMAYHRGTRRVVLFGGDDGGRELGDTWLWDGQSWQHAFPASAPAARAQHAMAYDPVREVVVLFGPRDTWAWDGATWRSVSPPGVPSPRRGAAMAFDQARGRVVLFGGVGAGAQADTWEWNGAAWTRSTQTPIPDARWRQSMAYDAARGVVVMVGGSGGGVAQASLGDTWVRNGEQWSLAAEPNPDLAGHAAAYDEARERVVLAGRDFFPLREFATWTWDGAELRQVAPAGTAGGGPQFRAQHSMAYDPVRERVVLFGGNDGLLFFPETWEWDGARWAQRAAAGAPSRLAAAMAYDRARQRVVLFGGNHAPGFTPADDTWEWDGQAWTRRAPAHRPPAVSAHAMAYDESRDVVVLFGGRDGTAQPLDQTWQWNGIDWTPRSPATRPPGTWGHGMAWDATRQRVVMTGGNVVGAVQTELWEWDGQTWSRGAVGPTPLSTLSSVTYDRRRERIVAFPGTATTVWELADQPDASVASFAAGCAGTDGVPDLTADGRPAVGAAAFALQIERLRTDTIAGVVLSTRAAAIDFGSGCRLYPLEPQFAFLLRADATGRARLAAPVPGDRALSGLRLYAQVLGLDPAGAWQGLLAFSNALELQIGL